jgi:hypothetical protein
MNAAYTVVIRQPAAFELMRIWEEASRCEVASAIKYLKA